MPPLADVRVTLRVEGDAAELATYSDSAGLYRFPAIAASARFISGSGRAAP